MASKTSTGHAPAHEKALVNHTLDMQQRELMGRHRLVEALIHENIEVAMPLRDRGVDLIAYMSATPESVAPTIAPSRFLAVPIQMKSASEERFSVHKKYEAIAGLLLVYVWHVENPAKLVFYAMTYKQSLAVAESRGMTKTNSWKTPKGKYSATRISDPLREQLRPFRVGGTRTWRSVMVEAAANT
jgi:hypothetical protein